MSDPCAQLRPALEAWLRADTEVIAGFGSNAVKVYGSNIPPVNVRAPYLTIDLSVTDDLATCIDAAEVEVAVHVWSLMNPPGFREAETLAAAVKTSLSLTEDGNSPAFTLGSFRVVASEATGTTYLTDPSDGKTVHAVIAARLSVDPI